MRAVARIYALVAAASLPFAAHAALVQCGNPGEEQCKIGDVLLLLVTIFNWLLGMGAVVAFIFLIYGGMKMFLYSVDESSLAAGKKTVIEALIGLAIVGLSYVIINTLLRAIGVSNPAEYFNGTKLQ